jgi:hypothetical protein
MPLKWQICGFLVLTTVSLCQIFLEILEKFISDVVYLTAVIFFISNLSKIRYTEYITLLFYLGLVTLNKAIEKKIHDLVKLGKYE